MDKSYWIASTTNKAEYKKLDKNIDTEIAIIGGGLTGLTTAYYLSKQGKKVVVLEKDKICNHTSGNSTAKITSGHGLFYDYLINLVGREKAREYLEANEQAILNIMKIIKEEKIECDLELQDAYIFTQKKEYLEEIEKEVNALITLGYPAEFVKDKEIPLNKVLKFKNKPDKENEINIEKNILGAVKYKNQAQFNPYLYGIGLAKKIEEYGSKIYENTKVEDIKKKDNYYEVITEGAKVKAEKIVIATHYPIINAPRFLFFKNVSRNFIFNCCAN